MSVCMHLKKDGHVIVLTIESVHPPHCICVSFAKTRFLMHMSNMQICVITLLLHYFFYFIVIIISVLLLLLLLLLLL